ncbi:transposase, partial [Paenibacillus radicis (ex Xue et al. 2023)]
HALDHDLAMAAFDTVKAKWGKKYPKEIKSWEDQLPTLLTFYKFPALIKEAIYTSNPIERMNKEFRKRLKPMNSLTNIDAAEKIVYLDTIDYNERFADRVIRGFGDLDVKKKLTELFEERYPFSTPKEE